MPTLSHLLFSTVVPSIVAASFTPCTSVIWGIPALTMNSMHGSQCLERMRPWFELIFPLSHWTFPVGSCLFKPCPHTGYHTVSFWPLLPVSGTSLWSTTQLTGSCSTLSNLFPEDKWLCPQWFSPWVYGNFEKLWNIWFEDITLT